MDFHIEYLYGFTYIPAKCRDNRKGVGHATMKVEIAELADNDVPVVMTVGNIPPKSGAHGLDDSFTRFLRKDDGSERRVRIKDGYFYVESCSLEALCEQARDLKQINATFLARGVGGERPPGLGSDRQRIEDVVTNMWSLRRNGGLREDMTVDDRGERVGRQIAEQAARIFAVDGITYELCREPILTIKRDQDGNTKHGIVESHANPAERMKGVFQHHFAGYEWTSSLNHAAHVLAEAGVDEPAVAFHVIDEYASCYDGVASDVHLHLAHALNQLGRTIHSSSIGALQVYYRLRDALKDVDLSMPSVSSEIVEMAEAVVAIGGDPDIDGPMSQLANARYMTQPSGTYRVPVNLDSGTGFGLMLDHVSDYKDKGEHSEKAHDYAKFVVDRWHGRHPASVVDNDSSYRMVTEGDRATTVTELGSVYQVRTACRDIGYPSVEMEAAMATGSRLFRVGKSPSSKGTSATLALLSSPSRDGGVRMWNVYARDGIDLDDPLAIVEAHLERMDERDMEISQDQQFISIF